MQSNSPAALEARRAAWAKARAKWRGKRNAYSREYATVHKDRLAANRRAYYETHRESLIAYASAYAKAHKRPPRSKARKEYARKHREEHREQYVEAGRRWRAAHPDKAREHKRRRAQRVRAQFVEHVSKAVLRERDGGDCWLCHAPMLDGDATIDHIIPIWRGGPHSYANTRLAHMLCNQKRGGRDGIAGRAALKQR